MQLPSTLKFPKLATFNKKEFFLGLPNISGIPASHKLLIRMASGMLACALLFLLVAVRQSRCALYDNALHESAVLGDLDRFKETLSQLRSQEPWNGSEGLQVGGLIVGVVSHSINRNLCIERNLGVLRYLSLFLFFYRTGCRIYFRHVTHLKTLHVAIPN